MSRLDTSLEAAGAEFLVLGLLLVEGVQATKAYTNFPGYDLVAVNPELGLSSRVQVKSRWATDFDGGFPIRSFECDFVVFVALNRGYRYRRKASASDEGRRSPEVYVFPVEVVRDAQRPTSTWGKVFLPHIDDVERYLDNWGLIKKRLKLSPARPSRSA
jgi:hypothetical protein